MSPTEFKFYDPSNTSSYDISTSSTPGSLAPISHISIKAGPKTDWWRTPEGSTPESNIERKSGPVVYTSLPRADWEMSGWIQWAGGVTKERFQQTAFFVSRDGLGKSKGRWLKSGIEEDHGTFVGAVVAAPYSDWSMSHIPPSTPSLFLRITRKGADIFIAYALPSDPERIIPLREIKGFARTDRQVDPYDDGAEDWVGGVMVCGPLSESTEGVVSKFSITSGVTPN